MRYVLMLILAVVHAAAHPESLKILMVVPQYPLALETFVINEIKGLINAGHDVHILGMRKAHDQKNLHHHALSSYHLDDKVYYGKVPQDKKKFDIIYAQFSYLWQKCLALKKEGVKGKTVVNFRGGDTMLNKSNAHREIAENVDCVLTVCHYIKDILVSYGYDPEKVFVQDSGIDCASFTFRERFKPEQGPIKIVGCGRLVEQKGFEYAIRAVAEILQVHTNLEFTIIGEGTQRAVLQNLIKQLNVDHAIKLVGKKKHEEVAQILDESHLFILPSVKSTRGNCEGIPTAIKEAMASGLPIISTKHAGIPELVEDDISGFLVPEKDVPMLVLRLRYLVEHPEVWAVMGLAGREKIQEAFEVTQESEKLSALFKKLVD